jgi:hypothetical protein
MQGLFRTVFKGTKSEMLSMLQDNCETSEIAALLVDESDLEYTVPGSPERGWIKNLSWSLFSYVGRKRTYDGERWEKWKCDDSAAPHTALGGRNVFSYFREIPDNAIIRLVYKLDMSGNCNGVEEDWEALICRHPSLESALMLNWIDYMSSQEGDCYYSPEGEDSYEGPGWLRHSTENCIGCEHGGERTLQSDPICMAWECEACDKNPRNYPLEPFEWWPLSISVAEFLAFFDIEETATTRFAGKTGVFTGEPEGYGRKEAEKKSLGAVGIKSIIFGGYTWRVLSVEGDRALIITEDVVEERAYNTDWEGITWAKCTLRSYLNGEFYNRFSTDEKAKILKTTNQNPDNPKYGTAGGADTKDYVFLLSIDQAKKYFKSDGERMANYGGSAARWWLRSPGDDRNCAACVDINGSVRVLGDIVYDHLRGVRPALWLNLES